MSSSIEHRRFLVTGAASGIGRATVVRLAADGGRIGAIDIDPEGLFSLAEEMGDSVLTKVADVATESDVADAISGIASEMGGLDGGVINAGIQLFDADTRAHELPLEAWQQTLHVNLTGAFLTAKHLLPEVMRVGGGAAVFTGSPTGLMGAAGFTAYSVSKGGIHTLTKTLAIDYASAGIRVNAVVPGYTDTPLVTPIKGTPRASEMIRAHVPLGRPGRPEEVAGVIRFLLSDDSAYMTGSIIVADGGMTTVRADFDSEEDI